MRAIKLSADPYRLPFVRPWVDHHGKHTERRGWIIQIKTEGMTGIGECAPFPSAGTETLDQADHWLRINLNRFKGLEIQDLLQVLDHEPSIPPAVQCGIETAAIDLLSKQANLSFSQWLNSKAVDKVLVNANLGALGADTASKLSQCDGYKVIKLKVGLSDPDTEIALLLALCDQLPEKVSLRLDANQAWNLDDALRISDACETLPIESIEEPLKNPTTELFQRIQASTSISIAADESLAQIPPEEFLSQPVVKRLVLKPMALSGPLHCLELAKQAYASDMDIVVTTTVDSAVGVWMATHLAATLGHRGCQTAHGLATSDWFKENTSQPPVVANGVIFLLR